MFDISSNGDVLVTKYRCCKKKPHENTGVTNDDDDDQTSNGEEYREKKEVVLSLLFTMNATTSDHHQKHLGNDFVLTGSSGNVNEESKGTENLRSYSRGSISLIGGRREMEDAVSVKLGLLTNYDFFGVYDGHGGSHVAHACRDLLHNLLMEVILEEEDGKLEVINWGKVMRTSFYKMDEEVNKFNGTEVPTIGSTAVVAVVGEEEVIVANCGDSRAVLSRGGVALPLSNDHKPDRPDELERIEKSGGKVINWNGHRVLGVLATSRSIGDNYLKPYVIPEPEVTVSKRSDADEFLILASDGLWDVIPNDVACDFIRRCLSGQIRRSKNGSESPQNKVMKENVAAEAAALLAELAIARGSRDNISIIIVELKKSLGTRDGNSIHTSLV